MNWSTACPDWRQRILAGSSLVPCPPLFPEMAQAALEIFKSLKAVDVPGSPTLGQICRPWVFEFVAAIFGAYDIQTGQRLINEFLLLISKKNGKSTIAAGIMVTALILNWRKSAELIILAPTLEVAKNSAEPAMDMVEQDPAILAILKPIRHVRTIEHRTTGAELKVIAADSETVSGEKAGFVLIDELWQFGKRSNAKTMLREALGGLASRPEGFVIALSTQSDDPPTGVWKDWLSRFRDIRDGKLTAPRSMGLLYEFPEEMIKSGAYKKPENFYITNPNLHASVQMQFLLDQFEKDKREGPKSLVGFFAKHLNVEPGIGERSDSWPGVEYWKRQADTSVTLEEILRRCEVVVIGLDGGGLDDLFGLTILGREPTEIEVDPEPNSVEAQAGTKKSVKRWLSWTHAWCHRIMLERRKGIESTLLGFEKNGELSIIDDGSDEDITQIVAHVQQVKDAGLLYCVAVDPAGLGDVVDALADIGVTQENKESKRDFIIGAPQGYGMMNAIKTAERKLANKTLIHADHGLMDWAVGNLKIEATATAIRATKQNAGDLKIDPVMSLFDAVVLMSTNPPAPQSVYEKRGFLVL
jgi:phage terminase large subunit-like protein